MSIRAMMIGGAGASPPGAPTIGTATAASQSASVTFSAPANNGGSAITGFTVTSSPSGITGTGSASPITVSGLTDGTAYTFTVTATNAVGTSPASAASNSVTPVTETELPRFIAQGQSSYTTAGKTGTINGVDYRHRNFSNAMGFGSSVASDAHGYYVTDNLGWQWYIAANWGRVAAGGLSRWGGQNHLGFPGVSAPSTYTTLDGTVIALTDMRGTTLSGSSTAANAIVFSDNPASAYFNLKPGNFHYDAVSFGNGSGAGFENWYADGSSSLQSYPGIVTAAYNVFGGSNPQIGQFDNPGSGQGNFDGGNVWWRPPLKTQEILIDYANSHSNGRCAVWCWDNTTGTLKWIINYGQFAGVDTTSSAINDPAARTIIAKHTEGFVYFNGDFAGTIAGSHYYLYR